MPWKHKPFGWGNVFAGEALFPDVQGATVAVLDEVSELIASDSSINEIIFSVDNVEPPSVELAIQLMLDQSNSSLKFECISDSEPTPDPRTSSAARPLWGFKRGKPFPAVPKPTEKAEHMCSQLARVSVDCADSWRLAKVEAATLGKVDIESLLSVMVFPPPVESDFTSTDWIRRVQLAAAQLAVCLEQAEGVSLSNSKVADVLNGPLDWSIDSAMVALAQRASEETDLIDQICDLVQSVLLRIPDKGTWSCRDVGKSVLRFLGVQRPSNSATQRE
jgi:hypothetical protein